MDPRDKQLLRLLQEDSHQSNAVLADQVGLSLSACARRVARLWSERFILAAPARLDRSRFKQPIGVFVMVTLEAPKAQVSQRFAKQICAYDSVQQCHAVTRDFDYLLLIEEASIEAYHEFAQSTFGEWRDVRAYKSVFRLAQSKNVDRLEERFLVERAL